MAKIKNKWGIRAQLVAGIVLVTVGAIALIGFLSIKMLEWNALHRKGKEAEVILTFIQALIQEGQDANMSGLKRFISKTAENGVINTLVIVDEKGKTIFITGRELLISKDVDGRTIFLLSNLNMQMIGGGWFEGIGKELLISAPAKGVGGSITFSMPLSDIREEGANFRWFIFFYALFDSIIVIALATYIFSKSIIRPMNLLRKITEDIAGGMIEQRVDIKASGEIASFATSFNVMADKLEEKIKALERLNKELFTKQEELVRSEKLATVGRLAAGIAHEIGNPLSAILGYVDILKKGDMGDAEAKEILERLGKEIARINNTIKRILDFSRQSKGVLQEVDVNKAIMDSIELLRPQFSRSNISFDMKLNEDITRILIDEGMFQQVILNLFLNAKDAMETGGNIIVETADAAMSEQKDQIKIRRGDSLGAAFVAMRGQAAGSRCIKISITDSGKGIAEDDIDKIFDPFFTTKEQGRGTGLGLAVSLGIIQAYGGDIKVRSELGKGTTFDVILPFSKPH